MTKRDILRALDRIDCQLSPENLTCDGELSHAQVRAKLNRLLKEKKELEKQFEEAVN